MTTPARTTDRSYDHDRARPRRTPDTGRSPAAGLPALAVLAFCVLALPPAPSAAQADEGVTTSHGLYLFGGLRYAADFKHFDYTNPDAPKGGDLVLTAPSATFDSLNPYIVKGTPAAGITAYLGQNLVYESLMVDGGDEAATEYGLIAETVAVPQDKSWVEFTLRANARWWDGTPITPEDVIFTFDTLKAKGIPLFRNYYANVSKAEKTGARKVRFSFSEKGNNELPYIIGELPVLSKAIGQARRSTRPPRRRRFRAAPTRLRVRHRALDHATSAMPDYWGKDLADQSSAATISRPSAYDYYRDGSVAIEALKAGKYDFR